MLGPEASCPGPATRDRSVLLVEDDELVREVLRDLLEGQGYTVEEAGTGKGALARFASGGLPGLLVTDLGLPDLRAADLVARLRERDPGLPVLLISGRPGSDPDVQHLLGAGRTLHAQKPFQLDALLSTLAALRHA